VCHILLKDPRFFELLLRIDIALAELARTGMCLCGGVLHRANYPRKPRGCPAGIRAYFETRFSFCCALCRRRTTSVSVRFFGRRVYVALLLVLSGDRHVNPTPATARLCQTLNIPYRTLARWRTWWREHFPQTPFWQAACARFMPPVVLAQLPASLLERFVGPASKALRRLLLFLTPLTIGYPVTLREGC
jgi:hypothetical protein